jgi:hypothetical protein
MGQKPEVTVAIGRLELRRGDILLLCSDGLSGKVQADEMRDIVQQTGDLEIACKKLTDLANERGGEDNITVVVALAFGEDLPVPTRAETVTQTFEVLQDYAPPPSKPPPGEGEKKMTEEQKEKSKEEKKEEDPPKKEEAPKKEAAKEEKKEENAEKKAEKAEEKEKEDEEEEEEEKPAKKPEKKAATKEEDEEDEEDEIEKKPAAAAPPSQEQRVKEMVTLAVVVLGLGLLIYYVFR